MGEVGTEGSQQTSPPTHQLWPWGLSRRSCGEGCAAPGTGVLRTWQGHLWPGPWEAVGTDCWPALSSTPAWGAIPAPCLPPVFLLNSDNPLPAQQSTLSPTKGDSNFCPLLTQPRLDCKVLRALKWFFYVGTGLGCLTPAEARGSALMCSWGCGGRNRWGWAETGSETVHCPAREVGAGRGGVWTGWGTGPHLASP